ncbi:putative ribose/galactose/methyl galactoside import ATP-binding protein 1 [Clostridia bacterium]|nr:putative ribose/galactose/methyl galactoside import ATP-binding protein 1 [Clostridia bacterium]
MAEPLVTMRNVSKAFPGVQALSSVSFDVLPGEAHALLGENGAGKSTLMKVLSGIYEPDEGDITICGKRAEHLTPKRAREMGVAIIHQELNMCHHLTVAENIFLGRETSRFMTLNQRDMNSRAAELLSHLNLDIAPDTLVGRLPVSKQQMVEIVKALSTNCKVIIMDEPTSALTAREVDELNRIIRELKARGCGVVYISHRLEELAAVADRVTILRDGRFVSTSNYADITVPQIIERMVGREIKEKFPTIPSKRGREILRAEHITTHAVKDVSFSLYEGEILGFAGLMGAGRTELMRALFGADPLLDGVITLEGKRIVIRSPRDAIRAGVVCVPEDRKKEGVCVNLPLRDNISLANLDWLCSPPYIVNKSKERATTAKAIDELKIKTPSQTQDAKNLSGGNQQKVVVGKWLVRDAKVFLFDEPTRGIDVAAKVEIYNLMNRMKHQGLGVLFVSSEMPEVLGMADHIIVMCEGRITGEFERGTVTQERIMEAATRFAVKAS